MGGAALPPLIVAACVCWWVGMASWSCCWWAWCPVLYPPRVNPYGIHGMGGGLQKFQMDSMEWGMDSIILVDGFHGMGDGFHTFSMEWGMDSILF